MKLTRRHFVGSGIAISALASAPALAIDPVAAGLRIADPALLHDAPPRGTLAASGHALLALMLEQQDKWQQISAVLGEADLRMLAEMVRFTPGLKWRAHQLQAGDVSREGPVRGAAWQVSASR